MDGKRDDRSQPLMRVPRDKTPAEITLDDGERTYVLLYIAPADRVTRIFLETSQFVPMTNGSGTRFVARSAIACVSTHATRAQLDEHLPTEVQQVRVKLRGGAEIRGEARWTAPIGFRRTQDHLNDGVPYFHVFEGDYVHFIAKANVLFVEEI
jgi:hypothetical protein